MLGEILCEETGTITGIRVLSSDERGVKVEVDLQTQGQILGVEEKSIWTYWSITRADGSLYGEGKGFMTTKDGDVLHLTGSGSAKAVEPDGTVNYRGVIYFQTASEKFSKLNGAAGVMEYTADGEGNTVLKVWEWS